MSKFERVRQDDLPEIEDVIFYRHDGRNKCVCALVNGEWESYSLFVGTWDAVPPEPPVLKNVVAYYFDEDEDIEWQKMADELMTEAAKAGAMRWEPESGWLTC